MEIFYHQIANIQMRLFYTFQIYFASTLKITIMSQWQ